MKDKEPNAITKEIDEWLLEFLFHGNCTILPALQESKSGQQVVQLFNKLQEFIQILGKNGQVQFNDIEDLILIFNRLQSFLESWKGQISWNETKKTERNSKGINVGYSLFDVLVLALEKSRKLLQEHEQRYRLIKENSIDVIWMMDVDSYKLTYASPSISNLRGITVKEAMNESLQEAVLPESYKVVYEYLQSLKELQPGEVVSPICKTLLIQQRHKNGHALAIEMNIIALPDANGFIRRITGVSRGSKSRSVVEEEKPKNDENIQRILDTIPVALVFVRVADNTIIYVNQKCCEVFGCTREDSIGRNSIHYWVNVTEWGEYVRQFRLQGFMKDYEAKMKRHGGERFWALISSAIVEYNGERVNISGIMDIQERKNLEIMAAKSEARFRTIVETVPFPFPIIITRKVDDVIMYVNTIAVEIFGFSNEETIGKSAVSIYVNPEERLFIGQEIKRYGCVNNREVMIKNSKEKVYYALISGATISVSGEEVILFGMQDITAMKIMEQELRKLATTDFLTNVANHRKWLELAEQEFSRFKRYGHVSSVLVLDLDHFKLINDQFGHQTGDEVLREFSVQCQSCLSEVDCMGRIGGEEFAILLPETGRDKAELIARKIQTAILNAQSGKDEQLVSYTVSIGITQFTTEDSSFSQVLSRADSAMYAAKQEGRNQFVSQ